MEEAREVEWLAHREVVLLGTTVVSVAGVARFCASIYMLTMGFGVWSYLRKLEILDLSQNNELDESSIPSLVAVSSLRSLYLSGNAFGSNRTIQQLSTMKLHTLDLGYNNFTGTLSTDICNMGDLEDLDLHHNVLFGEVPSCMRNLVSLKTLDLSDNIGLIVKFPTPIVENLTSMVKLSLRNIALEGVLFLSSLVNHSQLAHLSLESNGKKFHVQTENPATYLSAQLQVLRLRNCNLNGKSAVTPSFLIRQHALKDVDMTDNNLSGYFPSWLMENNVNLSRLCLGGNYFKGIFPSAFSHMDSLKFLDLSDNNFSDNIGAAFAGSMSNITALKLSGNHFYGSFPQDIVLPPLLQLLLSDNEIKGNFPQKICGSLQLMTFDAGNNQLTGPLPNCINQLTELAILNLRRNSLVGPIPLELCDLRYLWFVDVSENNFSVPNDMCNLRYLRLLDLSHNKLSGQLPLCLYIMGLDDGLFDFRSLFGTFPELFGVRYLPDQEEFMTKSREEYYKGDILNYMSGLDFSSNQLTGSIQESIGNMKWLRALNFSDNHLDGSIPNSLSKLSDLESLDLSHNKLIGQIPVELVALQSLAVFSVAYNNLSGPTPGTTGQFITFDQSSYEGNAYLCGLPLLKNCSMPPSTPPFKEHGDDKVDDIILFGCSAMFYLVGFWTSLGVLYFKRSWRCTWFSGVDRFGDFVMIKVPIFTRKIRSTNWPFWRAV
uniref:Uncharacterized protein n=1 Tax=Avena sativa TaxID=4498 RepID=A0ACD6AMC9_AVESA